MKANARFLIEEVGFCLWRQMNNHGNVLEFDIRDLKGTEWMMEFHDLQTDVARIMQGSGRWEKICSIRSVPNVSIFRVTMLGTVPIPVYHMWRTVTGGLLAISIWEGKCQEDVRNGILVGIFVGSWD